MSIENAKELKDNYQFHEALKLLENLDQESKNPNYSRLKAECYYQDLQLPMEERFKKAIKLLKIDNDKNHKETLRLKGAVFKRKYYYSKDIRDLHHSIFCYEQSLDDMKQDKDYDYDEGYGAANTVFLYCLLLDELDNSLSPELKEIYKNKIKLIANNSIKKLESFQKLGKWNYASLSSLYLVKNNFEKSKESMIKYKEFYKKGFEREQFITIEHMIKLFDVLPLKHEENKLLDILSSYEEAENIIKSIRIGKIGLALSGGGFRASLFHIGTLKRLAELDILRHIQVISTVSGGSIIGMYYYLHLKILLESKENNDLYQKDYIDLVNMIEKKFSKAIESNIRMSAFLKYPWIPLTEKLGILYQEKLFNTNICYMKDLEIKPKINTSKEKDFIPNFHNFELKNSVPKIIINATLLNNGHNWQFTAKNMGENKYMTDKSINKNKPYKEFDYSSEDSNITIGSAIAASSAVPILFDPIEIKLDNKLLKLSDGGLYDNMGLSSLIADECSHIIVSDGSGQLKEDKKPSSFRLDVLGRVTEVLMNKTRDSEYKMAKSLKEVGVLKGLSIFHMESKSTLDKELQEKLAQIRTDLDAFHELESTALVYAGYKIASDGFKEKSQKEDWSQFILDDKEEADFTIFENKFKTARKSVLKTLDISSKVLFKVPRLFILMLLLALIGTGLYLNIYKLIIVSISILVLYFLPIKRTTKTSLSWISSLFMIPLSLFHRAILDLWYVKKGKLNGK